MQFFAPSSFQSNGQSRLDSPTLELEKRVGVKTKKYSEGKTLAPSDVAVGSSDRRWAYENETCQKSMNISQRESCVMIDFTASIKNLDAPLQKHLGFNF